MEITRLEELRPRNVWEIIDDAFDIYRAHFSLFAAITAIVYVPYLLINMAATASLLGPLARGQFTSGFFTYAALTVPLSVLMYMLQIGATSLAVDDLLRGRAASVGSVYRRVVRHLFTLLFAGIIIALLTGFGVLLFYVGALLVVTYYAFTAPIIVLERRGPFAAGKRSRDLSIVNSGRVSGMILVLFALMMMLTSGITALLQGATYLIPGVAQAAAERQMQQMIIQQVIQGVASALLAPLPAIAITLLYFDVRVRHEALDMIVEAEAAGIPLAPDPFGGVGYGDAAAARRAQQRVERQRARAAVAATGTRTTGPPFGGGSR